MYLLCCQICNVYSEDIDVKDLEKYFLASSQRQSPGFSPKNFITLLKNVQTFCEQHNITLRHQYLLWCQGESDGDHHTSADEYTKQFMQMYEKLKAVGIEHCFLIGIGAYNGTADDICYDEIRNAQYSFAEHRKDITVVSRLFETMKARGLMKDSFHYYQAGYNEVGKDAAINTAKYVLTVAQQTLLFVLLIQKAPRTVLLNTMRGVVFISTGN